LRVHQIQNAITGRKCKQGALNWTQALLLCYPISSHIYYSAITVALFLTVICYCSTVPL
jgi:hypothetical protein